jgi:hypothetical protein
VPMYSIEFGEKLADVANFVVTDGLDDPGSPRVVLYLSYLSAEISLKAMLEKAGKPVCEIRKRSHKVAELLKDLDQCEVEVEIVPGTRKFVSASRLRACIIKQGKAQITVGKVIEAQKECCADGSVISASSYPNEIRYGDDLQHYPPDVVAQMASVVAGFARQHWHILRVK